MLTAQHRKHLTSVLRAKPTDTATGTLPVKGTNRPPLHTAVPVQNPGTHFCVLHEPKAQFLENGYGKKPLLYQVQVNQSNTE